MERNDIESYDDIRICRLNRIKIKNPKKWDQAKYADFISNEFISTFKKTKQRATEGEDILTINEEITIYEYAPIKF